MSRKSVFRKYRKYKAEIYLSIFSFLVIYIMYYLYSLPILTPFQKIVLKSCETILSGLVFAFVVSWFIRKIKKS